MMAGAGKPRPEEHFSYDDRLQIHVPDLKREWELLTMEEQSGLLYCWETIRGRIPDRILAFEMEIAALQQRADEEDDFECVCDLTWEIAEWASRINDLQILFRMQEDVSGKAHH